MKASDYLLAKAIEKNDFELSKLASEIKDTDQDIEFLTKEAGLWDGVGKGLFAAGKRLMTNNTIRNAAIGSGVGAVSGAANAGEGNRLSGALKGGLLGGAVGGVGTFGKEVYKASKIQGPLMNGQSKWGQAFKTAFKPIKDVGHSASEAFQLSKAKSAVESGILPAVERLPAVPKPSVPARVLEGGAEVPKRRSLVGLAASENPKPRGGGVIPKPTPVPTPKPVPQDPNGPYRAAIDRGFSTNTDLEKLKVHPQDPRLRDVPAIIRQKNVNGFTEADLVRMGIK